MSSTAATGTGAQPPLSSTLSNADFTYALAIAVAFVTTLILASYLCFRLTRHTETLNPTSSLSSGSSSVETGVILPRIIFVAEDEDGGGDDMQSSVVGADQRVINSYPKFPFSKSLKSDLMCPICLCEYKDAEMLRMLPECKHFFHVYCVDAWLKLSASCPVCRNSPLPTPLSEVVPLSHYTDGRNRRRASLLPSLNGLDNDGSAEKFMKQTLDTVIQKIKEEINNTREMPDESSHGPIFSAFLVDILGLIELVDISPNLRGMLVKRSQNVQKSQHQPRQSQAQDYKA